MGTEIDNEVRKNERINDEQPPENQDSRNLFTDEVQRNSDQERNRAGSEPRTFSEDKIKDALRASQELNLPIISLVTADGKLDPKELNSMKAHSAEAVFVSINKQHASEMMSKGMETTEFWALANLAGAAGDVNNIKAGFAGKFDARDFDRSNPRALKAREKGNAGLADLFIGDAASDGKVQTEDLEVRAAAGTKSAAETFNEDNVLAAIDAAKANGKPILAFNVGNGGLSQDMKAQIDALKNDNNIVLINRDNASAKMSQGIPSNEFWTLANLMGAKGDLNRIKDNYYAKFDANSFDAGNPKFGIKPSSESFDAKNDLPKIVAPRNDSNRESDSPVDAHKLQDNIPEDKFDFHQDLKPSVDNTLPDKKHPPSPEPDRKLPETVDAVPEPVQKPAEQKSEAKPETRVKPELKPELRPENLNKKEKEHKVAEQGDPHWLESQTESKTEKAKEEEGNKRVKLDQVKFADAELSKAVELAKKNNLPVVVYTGANFCHFCPAASEKLNNIAAEMSADQETKAVVVKLSSEVANSLASSNDANGNMLRQLLSQGTHVPRIAVYNPSDMSRPIGNTTIANWSEDSLRSHIDRASAEAMGKQTDRKAGAQSFSKRADSENLYNENSVLKAAEFAKSNDKPLIGFVSDKSNPNLLKAFEYLNQNKLAAAVEVSKSTAGQMFRNGLEPRHFEALRSVVSSNAKNSSFVSSFSSKNLNSSMKFSADRTAVPQSAGEMLQFLKDSGVDLSNKKHEKALLELLEGKSVSEEKAVNEFKVKTAEEAEKVLQEAKERNLPLIVHAPTTICTDTICSTEKLDPSIPEKFAGKAIFMEMPRGGFKGAEPADDDLKSINEKFKLSDTDHKTELDLHVFRFDEAKKIQQIDKDELRQLEKNKFEYLKLLLDQQ